MRKEYWLRCPYFDNGQCPQPESVIRAYLVPQLLNQSEIEPIRKRCRTCGKYLDEKRKYLRVAKPLHIILRKGDNATFKGHLVNISEGGALIKLQDWTDFDKDEEVVLEMYRFHGASDNTSISKKEVSGVVSRIGDERHQLAVLFIKDSND
jgi:hypothetical protein